MSGGGDGAPTGGDDDDAPTGGDLDGFRLAPRDALYLDLDGTLAEIVADPDAVALDPATAEALETLARRLDGAVVLISGRDIRDLASRTPAGLWRAGGHGLEVMAPHAEPPPPPAPPPEAVLAALRAVAARHPGTRLEIKGPVAALHYRADPDTAEECLEAAATAAAAAPEYLRQAGKMVVEVKPDSAHKGRTLRRLVTEPPFAGRRPVMFGDDTTDEDAIVAAQELGGLGVKVGCGASAARLRAADPAAVRAWLLGEAARRA